MNYTSYTRNDSFFKTVGRSALLGIGLFIVLFLLLDVVLIPTTNIFLPPESQPVIPAPTRSAGFLLFGSIKILYVASFFSGLCYSNTRRYPSLFDWPISMHGVLSGFIVGGLCPGLVLTLLSGQLYNIGWLILGIPSAAAGFAGNIVGSTLHWIVFYMRGGKIQL